MLKKILLGIILFFFLFFIGVGLFLYFNQEFIKNQTINALNQQLDARVDVNGEINLSFYSTFPNINLQLHHVIIEDKLRISDTLASVQTIGLVLNPWSIIQKDYTIQAINVQNGFIHIFTDKNGLSNYEILKAKEDTATTSSILQLNKIVLENIEIHYQDLQNNIDLKALTSSSTIAGLFDEKDFELTINTELYNEELFVNQTSLLTKKNIRGKLKLFYKSENACIQFNNNEIFIENNAFNIDGEICNATQQIDLIAKAEGKQLKNVLSLIPRDWLEVPEIKGDGSYNITAKVKGKLDDPSINLDFILNKGNVFIEEQKLQLSNVTAKGNYNNIANKNGSLNLENFAFETTNSNLKGSLQIADLNNINIFTNINGIIDKDLISKYLPEEFTITNGVININELSLNLSQNATTELWKLNKIEGVLGIKQLEGVLKKLDLAYSCSGELTGKDNYLSALDLNVQIGKNQLIFDGELKNLIELILNKDKENPPDFGIIGKLESNYFNLNDFIQSNETNNTATKQISLPPINGSLSIDFKHFIYQKLEIKNLAVKAKAENTAYQFQINNAETLGGSFKGKLLTNVHNNNFEINLDCDVKNVDIKNMFEAFNNFDQENLASHNLKGTLSANLNMSATWKDFTTFDADNFIMQSTISIKDGELINFSPLMSLSGKLKVEQLEHLYFTDLATSVFIKDQTITIPLTEIKSNLISLKLGGSHTFDNVINYKMQLNLKNILAAKFKAKQTINPDFVNEVEGGINIYISMTGTVDDPIISYDKTSVKEKIKEDFKEEKEEFKNLFKREEKSEFEKQEREFEKVKEEDKFLDWEE